MSKYDNVLDGLTYLKKFGECELNPGHDELSAGPKDSELIKGDDRLHMEGLGWFWNDEYECFTIFT